MSSDLNAKRQAIAGQMNAIGRRIGAGDETQLLLWVLPDRLKASFTRS